MGGAKTLQPLSLERVGKEGRGAACTKGGAWGCARSKGFLRIGAHGSQISSLLVAVRNGVYVHKSVQKYAIFPIRQNKSGKSLWFVHGIWIFDTGMMGGMGGKGNIFDGFVLSCQLLFLPLHQTYEDLWKNSIKHIPQRRWGATRLWRSPSIVTLTGG